MEDNPFLRHQSLTILQQIDELKQWHKQQQSKANPGSKNVNNRNTNKLNPEHYGDNHLSITNTNVSTGSLHNFDEMPIKVTNPNLIDIVENNVPPNEIIVENQQAPKPKFNFLKRGEGIARFRMGPQKNQKRQKIRTRLEQRNPPLQLTRPVPNFSNTTNEFQDDKFNNDRGNADKQKELPPLQPPDLQLDFKDWKSVFNSGKADDIIGKAIENNKLEIFQPNSSLDSSTVSIMEKLLVAGRKFIKDREELRVFEAMEQHVEDTSFCSTSSYVTKLMENAVMSTPEKIPVLNQDCSLQMNQPIQLHTIGVGDEIQNNSLQTVPEQNRSATPSSTNQENQQVSNKYELVNTIDNDELQQSLHVRFSEDVDYRSFVDRSQSVNSSSQKDASREEEFNDSEEWKQEGEDDSTCCSQCSTSYSSSEEDVRAISPPAQHSACVKTSQSKHHDYPRNSQIHRRNGTVEKLLVSDLKTDNVQSRTNNDLDNFPPILNEKLKELENEIDIFRVENNKIKSIREQLEKDRKLFILEKKKFMKEQEEEKNKISAQLEEERQKLAKEKFTFEKYSKTILKNPSKEERKEIQALREQLSEMKEDLNKKECRWGAAQARVRNQVKLLEEDNKKLKGEIEALTKKAKNLELLAHNKKSKAFNNTKLIHAINDHISSLTTQIQNEKVPIKSNGGYFNAKTVVIDEVNPKSCAIKVVDERSKKMNEQITNPLTGSDEANKLVETSHLHVQTTVETKENNIESKSLTNNMQSEIENQSPNTARQIFNDSGSVETVHPDGKREVRYKNGNVKKVDPLTGTEKTIYFNGDVKETTRDGTVKYYFSESRIWHTTLPDGLEVFDFPNGQVEKRHRDGLVEIVYPNNCKKLNYPDGSEIIYYPDGTSLRTEADKRKILSLPNGQKEIHSDECIRREYPDGTLKIVYADGTTETVYSNGRVRLKDKHGNLVMDSATSTNNRFPV